MKTNPLKILLLDGDTRQVLPLAKSLRRSGHHVTLLCQDRISYGSWSRYPNKHIIGPNCAENSDNYLAFLTNYLRNNPQDVTIPLFDDSATIVSKYKSLLNKYTRIPIPDWNIFMLARDKKKTMQLCSQIGIPHPTTFDPEKNNIESIAQELKYPCLVKPNIGYGAIGIRRVNSIHELINTYNKVKEEFGPCFIQEFIPQSGMQYKAQIFRGSGGKIHAAVVFNKIRYFPVTGGTSSLNCTVCRSDIVKSCCRLLDAMNWESHADVDLIEDPRDGIVKVMEVNPRVTGSIKIAFEAGVDFADLLIRHAMGDELPIYEKYKVGLHMRYMPLDILWFLYSPGRWKASPNWFKFWGSDLCYQEGSWDDPLPILAGFISGLKKYINPQFRSRKIGDS